MLRFCNIYYAIFKIDMMIAFTLNIDLSECVKLVYLRYRS